MNKYELVYIVDAHATAGVKDEIAKQVNEAAGKAGIKVTGTQVWMERHKMAFPINKVLEGTYYMLNLEGPASGLEKMHGLLRINEQVLRFLTVKLDAKGAAV